MVCSNIPWFRRRVMIWYDKHGRHFPWRNKSCTKYQLIIAEVLLQRTRAEMVAGFYPSFIREFPSWRVLASAKEKELQAFLRPLGLWRRRATSIIRLSSEMARRNGRFPKTRAELEGIPGIGQYIANSVLLLCHNQREPLLDVNMARVLERFFGPRKLADIRYDPYLQKLARDVLPRRRFKEFNWAILDFAAEVCKARNPACRICSLNSRCKYYRSLCV